MDELTWIEGADAELFPDTVAFTELDLRSARRADCGLPTVQARKSPCESLGPGASSKGDGAGEMNRTPDLLITNELLYRLSYTGYRQNRSCDPANEAILHTHLCKNYVSHEKVFS
jgi:hypothetical protein